MCLNLTRCELYQFSITLLLCIRLEGWKWYDSIYWASTVAMTVGYGDLIPKSRFSFIFPFFGVIFMLMPVYALSKALEDDEEECKEDRLMAKPEEL